MVSRFTLRLSSEVYNQLKRKADKIGISVNALVCNKDDEGNPLGVAPDTIIIPNDAVLKKTVFAVIGADKDPNTANNGFNFQFGRWNVIVDPYWVTTGSPYIVMSSQYNQDNVGAAWFDRVPLTVRADEDKTNDNMIWRGRARYSAGFNDWRAFAMGGVTTGTQLVPSA